MAATALTTQQSDAIATVESYIESNMDRLRKTVPKHLDPVNVSSLFLTTISANPNLMKCTADSLFGALLEAAQFGLNVGQGLLAESYLVPYGDEAKLIPGYRGLRKLARQAGMNLILESVHEGDQFENRGKLSPPLHIPSKNGERRFLPVVAAYMVAEDTVNRGMPVINVWTVGECEAHRNRYSQGYMRLVNKYGENHTKTKDNPWHRENPSFRVMCMKTVLRDSVARGEVAISNSVIRDIIDREFDTVETTEAVVSDHVALPEPIEKQPETEPVDDAITVLAEFESILRQSLDEARSPERIAEIRGKLEKRRQFRKVPITEDVKKPLYALIDDREQHLTTPSTRQKTVEEDAAERVADQTPVVVELSAKANQVLEDFTALWDACDSVEAGAKIRDKIDAETIPLGEDEGPTVAKMLHNEWTRRQAELRAR